MNTSNAWRGSRRGRNEPAKAARPSCSAGSRILAAIEEATEVLRSGGLGSARSTVRNYKIQPAARGYKAEDVQRVRELLGTSRAVLAGYLGVNIDTVRSWEQGRRLPQPIASRFLSEIESDPPYWRRRIGQNMHES